MKTLAAAITNPAISKTEGTIASLEQNPLGGLMSRLWWTAVIIGGIVLLIFLVWGGIDWLSSEGDQEKLKNAKNKMTHAVFGMAILAASFAIIRLTEVIFGLNVLQPVWPTASP